MPPMRLQVQTEHWMLGEGLRELLKGDADLVVTFGSTLAPGKVGEGVPGILLLDAAAPTSLERCAQLFHENPRPLVIMFGAEADENWAVHALRAGARGILSKAATVEQLRRAIHVVRDGQIWASQRAIAHALDLLADDNAGGGTHPDLTRRECEIMNHVGEGLSNKEIANRMTVSEATVKAHLTNIFRKLNVRDRLQLVILCQDRQRLAPVRSHLPSRRLQSSEV